MVRKFSVIARTADRLYAGNGQNGSIILIVLMLLVILSVIGISSTNTSVTENFIVRNTAIRKQNLHLADAAAMEVVQRVLDAGLNDVGSLGIDDILPAMPGHEVWVNDKSAWEGSTGLYASWYNRDFVGHVLDGSGPNNGFIVPLSISDPNGIQLLTDRGEVNNSIRYALVGWEFVTEGGENIVVNAQDAPIIRKANILVEYLSQDYGVIRLIVGIKKAFS